MTKSELNKLWTWARVELGMARAEFLSSTPAEIRRLVQGWKDRELRTDLRLARLCLTIAQSQGAKQENGAELTLQHFLPQAQPKKRRELSLLQQFCLATGSKPPKT